MPATPRVLIAAIALAIVAVLSVTVPAQAQLTAYAEPGNECPSVSVTNHTVTGGCHVGVVSTAPIVLLQHTSTTEVVFSTCNNSFEARVNGSGVGYIFDQALTGVACGRVACDEGEDSSTPHAVLPWPAQIEESAGIESFRVTFCLRAPNSAEGNGTPCTVVVRGSIAPGHQGNATTTETPCVNLGGIVELSGSWQSIATPGEEMEIVHL